MAFFPVFVELAGRRCLVIGGGPVAARKADALLGAGARVTVVSPTLVDSLAALERDGRIHRVARRYRRGDLAGFSLAFVATDDGRVNAAVAAEGRRAGVLVNAADDPAHCDFILPSVLRRGTLTIAVSTAGVSPAVARAVREALERWIPADYGTLTEAAGEVRRELSARRRAPAPEAWQRALGPDPGAVAAGASRDEIRRRLLERLGAAPW